MELPPFNLEDFTKWKTGQAIVKVRLSSVERQFLEYLADSALGNRHGGSRQIWGEGLRYLWHRKGIRPIRHQHWGKSNARHLSKPDLTMLLARLQIREGPNGQAVRTCVALRDGRRIFVWGHAPGEDDSIHVLRREDRCAPLQMLSLNYLILLFKKAALIKARNKFSIFVTLNLRE